MKTLSQGAFCFCVFKFKFKIFHTLFLYSGDENFANGLQTYLLSRDYFNLKSEFQKNDGKVVHFCLLLLV